PAPIKREVDAAVVESKAAVVLTRDNIIRIRGVKTMNSSACRRKEQSWLALTFLNSPGKELLHPTVRLGPDGPALPGWTLSLSVISRYVVTTPPDTPGCLSEPSARPSSTCASCSRIWFGVGSCCCDDTCCMLLNDSSAPKASAIKIDVVTSNRRKVLPPLHQQIYLSSSPSRSHPFPTQRYE